MNNTIDTKLTDENRRQAFDRADDLAGILGFKSVTIASSGYQAAGTFGAPPEHLFVRIDVDLEGRVSILAAGRNKFDLIKKICEIINLKGQEK